MRVLPSLFIVRVLPSLFIVRVPPVVEPSDIVPVGEPVELSMRPLLDIEPLPILPPLGIEPDPLPMLPLLDIEPVPLPLALPDIEPLFLGIDPLPEFGPDVVPGVTVVPGVLLEGDACWFSAVPGVRSWGVVPVPVDCAIATPATRVRQAVAITPMCFMDFFKSMLLLSEKPACRVGGGPTVGGKCRGKAQAMGMPGGRPSQNCRCQSVSARERRRRAAMARLGYFCCIHCCTDGHAWNVGPALGHDACQGIFMVAHGAAKKGQPPAAWCVFARPRQRSAC